MIRKTLLHLFLLAVPFITYAIYAKLTRRAEERGGTWKGAPWYWLLASGLVLSIAGAALLIADSGVEPGSTYVPSELKDGEIVPGHFNK